ncbi:ATP-dependent RNA helicase DbpA [Shewanella sp. 202IG2-18]|uniref:ATP-dependent RNA helicase DbpA n=1 Tax=Parashewanella hymeniacidonis TaxID=2807618 RepID=UPI001960C1B3|nr:ATP-dependent RNA helicase DbpA [Parashewanella hymeniacidonis]
MLSQSKTSSAFSSLPLKSELTSNLETMGYEKMTLIQEQSLPLILKGEDVIGQAKTGSGKTAAFGLGLLNKLDVKRFRIQSLVLCPTRELADQVAKEIRTLARGIHNIKVLTLCGGVPMGPQIGSLEHGAHIIVGTPGRLTDHLSRGRLDLSNVNLLILDEADRMLEMGFQDALDQILGETPHQRQTLLFSATFPKQIKSMTESIMYAPKRVEVKETHDNSSIEQHFYCLKNNDQRMQALRLLLLDKRPESAVVFCNTKRETQQVADELANLGFSALAIHGDLEQRDRDRVLLQFANKSLNVLVATDVAARGLDIDALDAVFNYHLPFDFEVHTHRVGRTGRAGSKGSAYTFYTEKGYITELIGESIGRQITSEALPSDNILADIPPVPEMKTIQIDGGKKQKLRPGDILGALTNGKEISGDEIGKIQISDIRAFVAVNRRIAKRALNKLKDGKIKGRNFRAWLV